MEGTSSESEQKQRLMISSFLEIAIGQPAETARLFLQATSWKLDEALFLFYSGNQNPHNLQDNYADEVPSRSRVSSTRTTNSQHEPNSSILGQIQDISSVLRDRLDPLYRPPFHLMFSGSFKQAKSAASAQNAWLLVNLQSTKEFSSHTLNRDTWANDAVSQTIKANFIFLQVYDHSTEGGRICIIYELESAPVVLLIDPTTGQKLRSWCGMIDPQSLLEDLVPFMDHGPRKHVHSSLSRKRPRGDPLTTPDLETKKDDVSVMGRKDEELRRAVENMKIATLAEKEETCSSSNATHTFEFPPLPEEPKGDCHRSVLCRVGVRLPDGRGLRRNFMKTDPIQLLWSFCYSQLEESERKPLKLTSAIPGASKTLEYESNLTFEQSGLENSLISVTWE